MIKNLEIWKKIDEIYSVSNKGRVRRDISGRHGGAKVGVKKLSANRDGYLCVDIHSKQAKVHRLVGTSFLKNPGNKPFINHINGIKNDNRPENLEWVTPAENNWHCINVLGNNRGEKCASSKLTEQQVIEIRAKFELCKCTKISLAQEYNVGKTCIGRIISRRTWKHI